MSTLTSMTGAVGGGRDVATEHSPTKQTPTKPRPCCGRHQKHCTCQPPKGMKHMQLTLLAKQFTETTLCSDGKLPTATLMLQMPLGTRNFATEQTDGSLEEQTPPPQDKHRMANFPRQLN